MQLQVAPDQGRCFQPIHQNTFLMLCKPTTARSSSSSSARCHAPPAAAISQAGYQHWHISSRNSNSISRFNAGRHASGLGKQCVLPGPHYAAMRQQNTDHTTSVQISYSCSFSCVVSLSLGWQLALAILHATDTCTRKAQSMKAVHAGVPKTQFKSLSLATCDSMPLAPNAIIWQPRSPDCTGKHHTSNTYVPCLLARTKVPTTTATGASD